MAPAYRIDSQRPQPTARTPVTVAELKDETGQRVSPVIPSVHAYPTLLGSLTFHGGMGELLGCHFFFFFIQVFFLCLFFPQVFFQVFSFLFFFSFVSPRFFSPPLPAARCLIFHTGLCLLGFFPFLSLLSPSSMSFFFSQ